MIEVVDFSLFSPEGRQKGKRKIIREATLEVEVNGNRFAKLQCSPADLDFLAVGFLLSEGLIDDRACIQALDIREGKDGQYVAEVKVAGGNEVFPRRHIASAGVSFHERVGGEIPPAESDLRVRGEAILETMERFGRMSPLYRESRGNHSAALSGGEGDIVLFSEDIGRHNCVDKILGRCLSEGIGTNDKMMLLSGRVSVEMVEKITNGGVPIIAAFGSPTSMAVYLLEKLGMALCWYGKDGELLIFGRDRRII